ncbi:fumarylacetoacetate hydrolase family protein [uncultured Algimonas sp.]|uniref:fumarylacetoacetate hydrolase family protein n=1 Tax=uncultured Algimonas sp. TaxID=1547920 RepID=UPI0026356F15|nr:fumarylacetoacetate hydrolase family protein [uncultured Algimonas sp.]
MTDYVFPPSDPASLPVIGTQARFPVRRIYCVGRNYADHVREMGGDPKRCEPIIFTKAAEALVESGCEIRYPPNTSDMHYEVELVVAIGPAGINGGIFGYGVGIDLTRRDLQATAKSKGAPWSRAKDFAAAAPCSDITPADQVDLSGAHIVLRQNGEIVQHGRLSDMIWSVEDIIAQIGGDMDLGPGDLIYTGTPDGVGPTVAGDELEGGIEGLAPIRVRIV